MPIRLFLLAIAAVVVAAAAPAPDPAAVNRIRAHVQFLASDDLEGRDAAGTGYRVAAQYVASQFAAIGLKPGGTNGSWFVEVPLRNATHASQPRIALIRNGRRTALRYGEDIGLRASVTQRTRKGEAGLVFAGRGMNDPALGLNDFAGLDMRGKIAIVMAGTPPGIAGEIAAHLESNKEEMAARAGAVGLIELPVPGVSTSRPGRIDPTAARVDWVEPTGSRPNALAYELAVSRKIASRVLEGTGISLDRLAAIAARGEALPRLTLTPTLAIEAESRWQDYSSPEVVGLLPGSDPKLSGEHIVLMGHLDHLGVRSGARPGEDRIYNGAMDNAAGVATMLEAARHFATSKAPRRTIMFIANTAEEKGLLGADFFAAHPTVPIGQVVGLVNLDMPLLLYDFNDVIAFGAEHSTIARTAASAGRSMGIAIASDPMPQETLFVRSDHYRFVQQGIPSIFLMTGYGNGGEAAWKRFLASTYHKPNDDLEQPINWQAGARFAELNYRIARALADADQRPMWYKGDYFGTRFAPLQPKAGRG